MTAPANFITFLGGSVFRNGRKTIQVIVTVIIIYNFTYKNKGFCEKVKYPAFAGCEIMTFGHCEIFRFAESEMK